jgi:YidC/Oxa1 family membrane protein insertase
MNTDKRVLIAIVLSLAVWLMYESFLAPPRTAPPAPGPAQTQERPAIETASLPAGVPQTKLTSTIPEILTAQQPTEPGRIITVYNGLYRMSLAGAQAVITSISLLNYKESLPPPALTAWIRKTFKLSNDEKNNGPDNFKEMIDLSLPDALPINTSFVYPNGTVASVTGWHVGSDTDEISAQDRPEHLVFSGVDQNSMQFEKKFEFRPDEYKIIFDMVITNTSLGTLEGNPFLEWTTKLPEKSGGGMFSSSGQSAPRFTYLIKDNIEKKNLADIEEEIIIQGDDVAWTAIEEKYFISAVIPETLRPAQIRLSASERIVSYKLVYPYLRLSPGESQSFKFALYIGPRDSAILQEQNAQLERTIDFGWFDIISKPLLLTLKFLNGFLHNWGISIIVLTIFIKLLFWPLTNKSFKSMKGMQNIQPEIKALKEKHKDNKEEFAKQQMALFKLHKVNPLGGCLPMVLQIPVFIALYRALMDSIELRHAAFIPFWINDLAAKDPTYIAPLIMGASMFLQQKMTPTTVDPSQAKIMMFMPVIFTVMFLNFPAGLVIYWLVNNLISIAQQMYINKK